MEFYAEKLPGCNLHIVLVLEAEMLLGKGMCVWSSSGKIKMSFSQRG